MFDSAIRKYSDSLDALRDFVALIGPFLEQKTIEDSERDLRYLLPFLLMVAAEHPRRYRMDVAGTCLKLRQIGIEVQLPATDVSTGETRPFNLSGPPDYIANFERAVDRLYQRYEQIGLLYANSLVGLASASECFVSRMLHTYYQAFPEALDSQDRDLSLAEIRALGSMEAVQAYAEDVRVEAVLRQGFEGWLDFLRTKLKLGMAYLAEHRCTIVEVFQRRHLLVHNGGVVNAVYLAKVDPALRVGVAIGDELDVPEPYLASAIDVFELCFVLIAAELWKRIAPADTERGELLINLAYNHLVSERWKVAESLSYFTMNDGKLPESDRLAGTINYWQSLKWQDRFHTVRDKVLAFDTSAKEDLYRLCQLALLDDADGFFGILPHVLDSGSLDADALAEWPIFREMRKQPQYEPYQSNSLDCRDGLEEQSTSSSVPTV